VVVFEDFSRTATKGEVPDADEDFTIPLGQADIKREGSDVTIISISGALRAAEEAAEQLAGEGIEAEIVDPRSIFPLDLDALLTSVAKTGKVVIADPSHDFSSVASHLAAEIAQEAFWDLEAPVQRVTTPHTHIPYAQSMEKPLYPNAERIVAAVHKTME